MPETTLAARDMLLRVKDSVAEVIVGKERVLDHLLVALLASGHVLIEDVPGVGKTSLVRSIAQALGLSFRRLQFTPDLMPADVTGLSIYDDDEHAFRFQAGPVFTNVLLADEINRTSPRTQSSLLEAMEERQVSVDGTTYPLPDPFFVLATENPVEYEGTFPLPEAQLDRFIMKVSMGYPSHADELRIVGLHSKTIRRTPLPPVMDVESVIVAQQAVLGITCSDAVVDYAVRIVQATRHRAEVYLGASPRGSLSLVRAGRALAYLRGRSFVLPDDIKELTPPVLNHRVLLKPEARLSGTKSRDVLAEILGTVAAPLPGRGDQ
jgi:MoxR-like ATPase